MFYIFEPYNTKNVLIINLSSINLFLFLISYIWHPPHIYHKKILKVHNANCNLVPIPVETAHLNNVWVYPLFINIQLNFLSLNQINLVTEESRRNHISHQFMWCICAVLSLFSKYLFFCFFVYIQCTVALWFLIFILFLFCFFSDTKYHLLIFFQLYVVIFSPLKQRKIFFITLCYRSFSYVFPIL